MGTGVGRTELWGAWDRGPYLALPPLRNAENNGGRPVKWSKGLMRSFKKVYQHPGASPEGSAVKNPPATQETPEMRVRSLGWEDPLEEGMATQSSILAWRIPWTEEPGGLQSMGLQRAGHD